ncbi:hypothetical protein MKW92_019660 [Papaver armeniacum]|nr:hypothetical protein MKW92_019660 [Papaver armeniacum]
MAFCGSVAACLAQTGPVFTILNEGFTLISSLCGCFGITSFHSIFAKGIPGHQELPTAGILGDKPKQTLTMIKKLLFYKANNHIRIVGLYGMGGVGKTTLLKELNNEFVNKSHGFDLSIWVVVSKDLNVKKIQDQIGNRLSLSWSEETDVYKRANDIFNVLNNKKFLLMLDDIWDRVDLDEIGIPNVMNNTNAKKNRSKIVLTTRIESVCGYMGAQRTIKVECLDRDEAWNLFHQTVFGTGDSRSGAHNESGIELNPVIRELAKEIAKECLGLPLALLAIGRAMTSRKELQQWQYALNTLRESAGRFSDMVDEVLLKLKFSYDNLRNKKLKSCFLYCSLFPEDYSIEIEELIDLWIGEGFLDEVRDIEEALLEGHDVIGCLKSACLLESSVIMNGDGVNEHGVKMHDVIRELAIWVASSDLGEINLKDSIQKQLNVHEWELAERISLIGSKGVSELTGAPKCINLSTLLLRGNEIRTLSDEFFHCMPRLKVLSMPQHLVMDKLPTSISFLSGLRYLNLSISSSLFSYDDALKPGTFNSLVSLKMLNLYNSSLCNWEKEGGPSLDELERLENLKSLGLTIESDLALKKLETSVKLQLCTKKLRIENNTGISIITLSSMPSSPFSTLAPIVVSLVNMVNLKILHLSSCSGTKELRIPSRDNMRSNLLFGHPWRMCDYDTVKQSLCFVNLKHVTITGCDKLKDVSWLIYAYNIETLYLGLQELEEIISDRFSRVTEFNINFPRLQTLILYNLRKLRSICNHNVNFPVLKHIGVMHCPNLKKLPFEARTLRKIEGQKKWWESLEWEDEITKSDLAPYFVNRG